MRTAFIAALLGAASLCTLATLPVAAQDQPQAAAYSVATTPVGALLDDPRSRAILQEIIPTVFANEMFHTMGRSQTLRAIQQFEPVALSDEVLARIQAAFDRLAAGGAAG